MSSESTSMCVGVLLGVSVDILARWGVDGVEIVAVRGITTVPSVRDVELALSVDQIDELEAELAKKLGPNPYEEESEDG